MLKLLVAVSVALAFPATALGDVTMVTRDLPVGGARTLASAQAPGRFNMIGLHWRGPGRVYFRTSSAHGWSRWHQADAEDDLPDTGTAESRRMHGWRIGNPWWTGTAERLEVKTRGVVRRVRAHYLWSPEELNPGRSLQIAGSPKIILRSAWGANERIRRDNPSYATRLLDAVVHHTAGASPRTPGESAAIVRGIMNYHVLGNGWDDIGYNFLVDRFGQVFEGRYGGIERNVIGAHAQGFNTGSVGIAVIGTYGSGPPSTAANDALAKLIAWRLDVAHLDPLSRNQTISLGNPRFRKGMPVWLRAVSGHRDTGFTSCPGAGLYGRLGAIGQTAAVTGLPKLYTPEVEGALGGLVSFSARLSSSLPWTVQVFNAAKQQVAIGSGTGRLVQWTWDSRLQPPGAYTYRIGAGPNLRPATGRFTSAPGAIAAIGALRASPSGFTPNGDGVTDATQISYTLAAAATVSIDLQAEDGTALAPLYGANEPAGPHTFLWDGTGYPDGRYRIQVTARTARRVVTAATNVVLSRTLSGFALTPTVLSPNGDGRNDAATITFNLLVPAFARVEARKGGKPVVRPLNRPLPAGPQTVSWKAGVRDGEYDLALTITDATGPVTQLVKVRVDRRAPKLTRVPGRLLRVSLSEPARVTFIADGLPIIIRRPKAGIFRVVLEGPPKRLQAYAEDDAGNRSTRLKLR
jgi:N-acetylmuramoyl-L-alanine amidase-like protein